MAYKVYRNSNLNVTVGGLTTNITGLQPNTKYTFVVTETDGEDESEKSTPVTVTTNGQIIVPTTKTISKLSYSENPLGLEAAGLGTTNQFGGSTPVTVTIKSNVVSGSTRILEVDPKYHMGGQPAILVESNKYLIIHGIKSMEIIIN